MVNPNLFANEPKDQETFEPDKLGEPDIVKNKVDLKWVYKANDSKPLISFDSTKAYKPHIKQVRA